MLLLINGEPRQIEKSTNLHHLLEELGYEPKSIAVALNGRFVPRHEYTSCVLEGGGDTQALEVVSPMQGG